jgi:drug/metabolite transporter (DMT)-like permease
MTDSSGKRSIHLATAATLGAGVLWGTSCLFVRSMSGFGMTSSMQTAFKMLLTGAFYWILILLTDRSKLKIKLKDIWMFILAGFISMAVFTWLHYYVLIHGQASVTTALIYTSPIFVMLLSAIFFKEKITTIKVIAVLLAVSGCALTAGVLSETYRTPLLIAAGSILAGFAYSTYSIFAKLATRTYNSLTMTAYSFLFAAIFTVPFGHMPQALHLMKLHPQLILLVLGKSIITSAAPYFLYTWGISRIEAGRAAVSAVMEPLVTCTLGILVFQEPANAAKITGILLILISVIIVNLRKA